MPVSSLPGEDDIIARLKTIPGVDVIEGEYTEDSYKPSIDTTTGMFRPYLTVKFDASAQTFDNGIADPSWDTQRAGFQVFIVSPADRVTRNLRDQVREKLLVSFRPTDGSYLKPRGGYSFVDPDLGYHRYVQVAGFTYTFNLSPSVL
jgi:hypothetical protein